MDGHLEVTSTASATLLRLSLLLLSGANNREKESGGRSLPAMGPRGIGKAVSVTTKKVHCCDAQAQNEQQHWWASVRSLMPFLGCDQMSYLNWRIPVQNFIPVF